MEADGALACFLLQPTLIKSIHHSHHTTTASMAPKARKKGGGRRTQDPSEPEPASNGEAAPGAEQQAPQEQRLRPRGRAHAAIVPSALCKLKRQSDSHTSFRCLNCAALSESARGWLLARGTTDDPLRIYID